MSEKSIDELLLLALEYVRSSPEASALGAEIQGQLGISAEDAEEVLYFLEESEFVECDHGSDRARLEHSLLRLTSRGRLHLERKTRTLGGKPSRKAGLPVKWFWGLGTVASLAALLAWLLLG
jgi:hypothetical protein